MEKIIDRRGIECSGVSFTPAMNEKFKKYMEVIENHINEEISYAQLQEYIQEEKEITKSAVRVDIPFLYNNGFVTEYRNVKIKLNNFVTDLGKSYLDIVQAIDGANEIGQEPIVKILKETLSLIMALAIVHRKRTNSQEYYLDILKFIYLNGSINEDEFYLMVTSADKEVLKEELKDYRNGDLTIKLETNNLAYKYTKKFLEQANLIQESTSGRMILNENMITIIKKIVE